ncbi:MAG: adenylate/guanylate cyclase domain-containing protein [Sphingomonadales bacterium]|nr:adenylate/guanylate cyclase domain-containing protein [Sphingomonadales bacterium]
MAGPRVLCANAAKVARQIGRWQLAVALVVLAAAVLVARYSWHLPLFLDAEHAMYDFRTVVAAPLVRQDSRIVIVPYTDDTLIATGKRSPLDRATLARALTRLDAMGAKAIGIDILIDQPQPEDPQLIAAFRAMRTPTYLAYASTRGASDKIIYRQQQFLDQFQRAIAGRNVHPASIMLQTDSDNVLRRWPELLPGAPPRLPNAMAPQVRDFATYEGALAYRRPAQNDEPVFNTIPIDTFADDAIFAAPGAADLFAQQIRGRYVFIGGNIEDIDLFQTPLSRATVKGELRSEWGMNLFAAMLAQLLDNRPLHPFPAYALWLVAVAVVAAGGLTAALNRGAAMTGIILIGQLLGLAGLPFYLASTGNDTYGLPASGWLAGWIIAFLVVLMAARTLTSEQRRFAQGALGKYLPRDIAAQIIRDPDSLQLKGEKRAIFVLFSDLEGFTALSHAIAPEMVAYLLNRYLDLLSDVVLSHGGTIDKFVGDAVVAFWGAPVSRPDDGRNAVEAAMAMYQAGEQFRSEAPEGVPPIGRTRVGLHYGEAIVGNFGGEGRIQYTALGDAMNTAARLESANKQIGTSVLVSGPVVERCGLDIFRFLGRVVLSGRASALAIYEPVPDVSAEERRSFSALAESANAGDAGAVAQIAALAAAAPEDKALVKFAYRLDQQKGTDHYVLESK